MSDNLMREFRTRLTRTMDSVLKAAVYEIIKIFESSLHDHRMELGHKEEELSELKVKLQRVETKMEETESGGDPEVEINTGQTNQAQQTELPEMIPNTPGPPSDVPEIDFEVPDDWCAPLGCEIVTKQDEDVCPSVRLRPLYIPLFPIPHNEIKAVDIQAYQGKKRGRRPKTGFSSNERQERSNTKDKEAHCPPVKNTKKLLQNMKWECDSLTDGIGITRRERNSAGKKQENTRRRRRGRRKNSQTESESVKQEIVKTVGAKRFLTCTFCKREFNSVFGLSVHERSHKRCKGCKRHFPLQKTLKYHQLHCRKLKKLSVKAAQATVTQTPQSNDEEKQATTSKNRVKNKEITPSSSDHSETSAAKDKLTKSYSCSVCNKIFHVRLQFDKHMQIHFGKKLFLCSFCPREFRYKQSMISHIIKKHHDKEMSSGTNGDLAWTERFEVMEKNLDLISPSVDTSQTVNDNSAQKECKQGKEAKPNWQTMSRQCSGGFMCLFCQKVLKHKYMLMKHLCKHRSEPIKCDKCLARFRHHIQLCVHKKMGCSSMIECEWCPRKFYCRQNYDKHVSSHRNWSARLVENATSLKET